MRPNSKTYNADFGSSFQRQPYRTFQAKPKAADLDRWDHGGFDQLQTEHQDRSSKFPRNRKNQPDNTMAADSIDNTSRGRGFNQEKVRWAHDKYQENTEDFAESKDKEEATVKETVLPQGAKTKKRPDRQLYSVRQKYSGKNDDTKKTVVPSSEAGSLKKDEASPYLKGVKDVLLNGLDDKEVHSIEDDKLSISNVSTAMSDRLRNWEEESYLKSELLKDRVDTSDMAHSPKDKENSEVVFDIVLESENGANILRIYYGEEDYEILLDSVCNKSNFDARTALYFKINMMQMIVEAGVGNEKASAALDRLLDVNYKILMCESGLCEADEDIASYLESTNNEFILENLEDSY